MNHLRQFLLALFFALTSTVVVDENPEIDDLIDSLLLTYESVASFENSIDGGDAESGVEKKLNVPEGQMAPPPIRFVRRDNNGSDSLSE